MIQPTALPAAERVAAALREQIIEGRFRPGQALRETSLAGSLGASRNTVREAFRLLAHDGLVEHAPHRGVTVRTLTVADVADIYRIRRALEQLGLDRVEAPVLAQVTATATALADARDWLGVSTQDLRFHREIVAALDSPRLDAMFTRLLAELRLAFATMPDLPGFHGPFVGRNQRLVDLLADGDRTGARGELAAYLDDAERQLTTMLAYSNR